MNSLWMRKIDLWFGVPLCWLMSLWARLAGRRGRDREGPPRRVLFIELAEIGGLVVAYPALARARALFPQAELYFLTFQAGQGILDLLGVVDRTHQIIIRPDGLPTFLADTWRAIRTMRRLGIDATVNLETFARFSTLLAYLSGAGRRAGFHRFHDEGRYLGELVTHKVVYNPHVHAALTFVSLAQALAEPASDQPRAKVSLQGVSLDLPRLEAGGPARAAMAAKLREQFPDYAKGQRLVLVNPNASDLVPVRRWPLESFLELIQGLLEDPELLVAFTGTRGERPQAEELRQRLGSPRVLDMAGQTTLPELIDLYNLADLLITNDSGPAHFASLAGLPTLVMFGPETPDIYGPLGPQVRVVYRGLACSPCVSAYNQKLSPCRDNLCMRGITPTGMLERARAILAGGDSPK